ncbi:hypothetical protein D3C84_531470 [compost metagenome]
MRGGLLDGAAEELLGGIQFAFHQADVADIVAGLGTFADLLEGGKRLLVPLHACQQQPVIAP